MSHNFPVATSTRLGQVTIVSGGEAEGTARRGAANGYASLNGSSEVEQVPSNVALKAISATTPAADLLAYYTSGSTAALATLTSFARTLLDDVNQAAGQATLGVVPGTHVQAYNAILSALAALTYTDGGFLVGDGSTVVVESGATARTSLGLGAGDSPSFTNVTISGTPSAANHAARLADVAGIAVKASVRVATAGALPSYVVAGSGVGKTLTASVNGALTIDGVAVQVGNRVLVKDPSDADVGIYVVTAKGSGAAKFVLTRASDWDEQTDIAPNSTLWVAEGTANADTQWTLTTNDPFVFETDPLAFTQTNGLGQINDGAGLSKTGNTLNVNVDGSTVEISGDALRVKAGGITDNEIASITTRAKLPAEIPYTDAANTFSLAQTFSGPVVINGGVRVGIRNVTSSPYTIVASDHHVRAGNGAGTVNLPAATGTGRVVVIKRVGNTPVTVVAAGSDVIDDAASQSMGSQYQAFTLTDAAAGVWDIT